ncbi:MAG: NADH-quinone oxidoreductase subunit NuoK [Thermoanaerobaculia bacterium]
MPSTQAFLVLSAAMFTIGIVGIVVRRNIIVILMCIELMLNAVNINFIAFAKRLAAIEGQIFPIFIIAVAAGEAAVGLAIAIQLFRLKNSVNVDEARQLRG